MNREQLSELGLDKAQIEAVMAMHGATMNSLNEEKATLNTQVKQLTESVEQRDAQLAKLKSNDSEELNQRIDALIAENKTLKEEHDHQIIEQQRQHKIELLANSVGTSDATYISHKLQDLAFEDGELIGAEERINELKEEHPLLFEQPQEQQKLGKWSHGKGNTTNSALTLDEINKIKDPIQRQQAIAQNMNLF